MMRSAVLLALLLAAPLAAAAPASRIGPQDTCSAEPSARAFRDAIRAAVTRRDSAAIGALADPEILLDFGGGAGRDEFVKRLAGPDGHGSWADLAEVLALGCGNDGDTLAMPNVPMADTDDAYATLLVVGADVPLRARPGRSGRVLARLDWATVELTGDYREDRAFQHVRAVGRPGRGWIETARLRSVIDFRLRATREPDGPWRIATFIAGD